MCNSGWRGLKNSTLGALSLRQKGGNCRSLQPWGYVVSQVLSSEGGPKEFGNPIGFVSVMRFGDGWSLQLAAISGKGPLVCAAVSSTKHPHLGTFEVTGTSDDLPLPIAHTTPLIGARCKGPFSMACGLAREKRRAAWIEGQCGGLCMDVDC